MVFYKKINFGRESKTLAFLMFFTGAMVLFSINPVLASSHTFKEDFTLKGDHAATDTVYGKNMTVWWNAHNWDTRQNTSYNSFDNGNGSSNGGDHIDLHGASADLSDGKRVDRNVLGGDGGPGMGIMHLDFEAIVSARLRTPMIISDSKPGVVEFRASNFMTTGHWWELIVTPTNIVRPAEFTGIPSPGVGLGINRGPGHRPAEDSYNFIVIGKDDVPCTTGWGVETGITKTIKGTTSEFVGPQFQTGAVPAAQDVLYAWRFEFYPWGTKVFVDLNQDGVKEPFHTFNVPIPWSEVYVHLAGVAYQADHHPQNGTDPQGNSCFRGQLRELQWKEVRVGPVKYDKTRAYPKESGTDHIPQKTGWVGFDLRDNNRFGTVDGIPQPNNKEYDTWTSLGICNTGWFCNNPTSSKTLTFDLPAEDATGIKHAQFIYDIRYDGPVTLTVNGTAIGTLSGQSTVPGHKPNGETHWVQRSLEVPPSLFKSGTNTIKLDLSGKAALDRMQFEFGYGGNGPPPPPPNQFPTANAGPDQTITDSDGNGTESITLNGSKSFDSDGTITSYIWKENNAQIATGVSSTVNLSVGTHTITLTVTDDDGDSSSDTVLITVNAVAPPPPPPPPPGSLPWLKVSGNKIVNEANQTVVLRGVNIEKREWIWASGPSIEYEKKAIPVSAGDAPSGWNSNVIVIAFASGPVVRNDSLYLGFIDEIVSLAKKNGAYTLLVYRYGEPNGDQPTMPNQEAQNALAALALRYKNEPAVLYGLQVEPHDVTWSTLKPRFISMIDAIRANNPNALIMVPGTQWGRYIYWAIDDPIARTNLVYKSHPYDSWNSIQTEYRFDEVSVKYPIFLGEFGDGSFMNLGDVKNLLNYSESKGISWAAWLFNDEGCPCLLANRNTFAPTTYGAEIKSRLQNAGGPPPADTTPPVISNIAAGAQSNSATITWNTNEVATSLVEYGLTSALGTLTPISAPLTTSHSVIISGLSASTTYYYKVKSKDASGNEAVSPASPAQFVTLGKTGGKVVCAISTQTQPQAEPPLCNLNKGEAAEVTLKNGEKRVVTLLDVKPTVVKFVQADSSSGDFIFRAESTVDVDGIVYTMGVAMDQPYTIAKGLRMYAMRSKIFTTDAIWAESWNYDLTLMLTDASAAPFDTSLYWYPLDQLWSLNEHAGREAYSGRHHDGYDIGVPHLASAPAKLFAHLDGKIWDFGPVYAGAESTNNRADISITTNQWDSKRASYFHLLSLAQGLSKGSAVSKGQWIANPGLINEGGYPHLHWVGGNGLLINEFPFLRETYYTHMATLPKYAEYIKDWLVIGPFSDANTDRIHTDHLGGQESTIQPSVGMVVNNKTWKMYDNLIPGAIDFASALSPAPYSGYAVKVEKNYPKSVGYAHIYVNSPAAQTVQLWMGYNDAVQVRLNDSLAYEENTDYRYDSKKKNEIVPDKAKINLNLNSGWNRLLVKVSQDAEDIETGGYWNTPNSWKFSAKIVDASGNKVSGLTTQADKPGIPPPPPPPPPGDTTPPFRSNGSPSGILPVGTTETTISLATNETATCKYSTSPEVSYDAMASVFTTSGTTSHSTVVAGLVGGKAYQYFVRCSDLAGNKNTDDFLIQFSIAETDSIPPIRSNGKPEGVLPAGTQSSIISLATNEDTTCKYSLTSGKSYDAMEKTFDTTGAKFHQSPISGLTDGKVYSYFVRCADKAGNKNTDDFLIQFSVGEKGDITPPFRYDGQPTDTLPAGTKRAVISLRTDEKASCRYSLASDAPYDSMTQSFKASKGGLRHQATVKGLENGKRYVYYVKCADSKNNKNDTNFLIEFEVKAKRTDNKLPPPILADITPPFRYDGQPTGTLPAGTKGTTISLKTDEKASCLYSLKPDVLYDSIDKAQKFVTTDGFKHSLPVEGLADGQRYTYYAKCEDVLVNKNDSDFLIEFEVSAADIIPPVRSIEPVITKVSVGRTVLKVPIQLKTDEKATCKYSKTPGIAYTDMWYDFNETGNAHHKAIVSSVNGAVERIYVKCRDNSGNINSEDFVAELNVGGKNDTTQLLEEGDLIRGPDGIKVFIINENGYMRHIFNPVVFTMYGHFRWEDIKDVSQEVKDAFTESDLYRSESDPRVYSLEEVDEADGIAVKRHVNMGASRFLERGFRWGQIFAINDVEKAYYAEGVEVRD